VFRLAWSTPPEWVARVEHAPLALLSDHAHCELKAAASAQALIAKNTEHADLALRMAEVAVEELEHFRTVVGVLRGRGGALASQDESPYAAALHRGAAASRNHPLLLDRLLLAHLIEERSLERFHLLAEHLADARLAALYRALLPSEAEHRVLFLRFARELFPDTADARADTLRELEGRVISALPCAPRIHSGFDVAEVRAS
jgi:tRNA-(ms[2]io[6]A)-hydroxylase